MSKSLGTKSAPRGTCTTALATVLCLVAPALRAQDAATVVPDGLSASDWSNIRAAYEADRQHVFAVDDGWRARNPGQRWTTAFDGRGFTITPDAAGWAFGLELRSYGWGGEQHRVAHPRSVAADGGRLAYRWDERITEWYVNDARGLEHGYTLATRPASADGSLTMMLAVRGGLDARVAANGRDVSFLAAGARLVDYTGLVVVDVEGRALPARFAAKPEGLLLTVDDACARYPITIDPLAQQAYLKASNTGSVDKFGNSVAVSANTVVVGAWSEDSAATGVNGNGADNMKDESGAAYVFVRDGTTWSQQAYLKASNTDLADHFGVSVAVSGETIVVGADGEDSAATGVNGNQASNSASSAGAAYVFVRSGTIWSQQAYLKASNTSGADAFGSSVAVSGDTIVVGARSEGNAGAAYIFLRSGTTWSQQAYLKASNADSADYFGDSVAVSGEIVVVGAQSEASAATGVNGNGTDNSKPLSGAAYVFVRNGTTWSQQAYLKASNTDSLDAFGQSVAVSGDTVVVGAYRENSAATGVNGDQASNGANDAGAAYVFVHNGTTWSQQAYLKASNTQAEDAFGHSVAVSGDTIAVGAHGEDSAAPGVNGNQASNAAPGSGAGYVFVRSGTTWSQQAYLKASNPGLDQFGFAVAVSGSTVVVGAHQEDSGATGVNGDGTDNTATDSGAAYIFDVCPTAAAAATYGAGKAGTFGVPVLSTTGTPAMGTTFGLVLSGGFPLATPVLLFAGVAPASVPFDGGTLLVTPAFVVALPPLDASGGFTLPVMLTEWACGVALYVQVMFVDPNVPNYYHTAQTNGVLWTIGG